MRLFARFRRSKQKDEQGRKSARQLQPGGIAVQARRFRLAVGEARRQPEEAVFGHPRPADRQG